MGKQELCTNISGDSTIYSNKKIKRSKLSIQNKLIPSKKITDIPSRYKTEEIKLERLNPDILCYNIETPNDKHGNKKDHTGNPKKNNNIQKDSLISNPHQHYFPYDYSDHFHKESIHAVESNISKEPITWKTSNMRLLHSKLRPDTSNTSNIVLPNLKYSLSTEKLRKLKYPKGVPPPAFKQVGTYKCKIPIMTSKERLDQRKIVRKEQEKLKKKESVLSADTLQQSKFIKQKENTQYDILFGKKNLENLNREYYGDDKTLESKHKKETATRKLLKRFRKVPSRSESEIGVITAESSQLLKKVSSIHLLIEDDDDDDSEIEEPEEESEESEESEEETEDESEEESEEETEQELKQDSKPKDYFKEEPNEESSIEIVPNEESLKQLQKRESPIKAIDVKEIPIKVIHTEKDGIKSDVFKRESLRSESKLPDVFKRESLRNESKLPSCARIGKCQTIVYKECDGKLCTYDKKGQDKVCEKLICPKAFPRLSTRYPNNNHMAKFPPKDLRNPIDNRLEIFEQELQVISMNSFPNGSKCGRRSKSTNNLKKSAYDSREEFNEEELQNYDYLTNRVSQTYHNLKTTDHMLLLDLNFENKITQTRHSRRKEKNMQTRNNSSSKSNRLQVTNQKDFKIIPKSPLGVPQWVITSKPSIDMIYKNIKYISCPKNCKTIIPHGNPQRTSVNNGNYSYNNNLQYNLRQNNNYAMFTYFVNVQQKCNDNLQHSLNLKTVDRNLIIKFV